jgi:hypothetical protein
MAQFVQTTSNIGTPVTGATAGTVFEANEARVYFQIQNVGANPIYLGFGSSTPSAAACHQILQAGTAALDGKGGIYKSETVVYTGKVSVGGTAPTYMAFQITP